MLRFVHLILLAFVYVLGCAGILTLPLYGFGFLFLVPAVAMACVAFPLGGWLLVSHRELGRVRAAEHVAFFASVAPVAFVGGLLLDMAVVPGSTIVVVLAPAVCASIYLVMFGLVPGRGGRPLSPPWALGLLLATWGTCFGIWTRHAPMATLIAAAAEAPRPIVWVLLADGRPVDAEDEAGRTPLMAAAQAGRADVVALLLARGADPSRADNGGATPLSVAVAHAEVVRVLLEAGATVDEPGLVSAARAGNLELVEELLVRRPELSRRRALQEAARNGRRAPPRPPRDDRPAIALLLARGADPTIPLYGRPLAEIAEQQGLHDLAARLHAPP